MKREWKRGTLAFVSFHHQCCSSWHASYQRFVLCAACFTCAIQSLIFVWYLTPPLIPQKWQLTIPSRFFRRSSSHRRLQCQEGYYQIKYVYNLIKNAVKPLSSAAKNVTEFVSGIRSGCRCVNWSRSGKRYSANCSCSDRLIIIWLFLVFIFQRGNQQKYLI